MYLKEGNNKTMTTMKRKKKGLIQTSDFSGVSPEKIPLLPSTLSN